MLISHLFYHFTTLLAFSLFWHIIFGAVKEFYQIAESAVKLFFLLVSCHFVLHILQLTSNPSHAQTVGFLQLDEVHIWISPIKSKGILFALGSDYFDMVDIYLSLAWMFHSQDKSPLRFSFHCGKGSSAINIYPHCMLQISFFIWFNFKAISNSSGNKPFD